MRWILARPAALLVVGLALLQALWIVTLPPFAASDEFEHAYRAAGVAAGEFRLDRPAVAGRGELTTVPAPLVDAASAQCDSLDYTGPDTCFGAEELSGGRVLVATAAGSYHPAFYLVVGTVAEPFSGAAALYAMRVAAALLCLALVAAAAWLQRSRGSWTRLGLVVSLTPTAVYTTSVGAPNGAEISAGLLLWVSLLELGSEEPPERPRAAFWCAVLAACLLVTLRLLGPLFLVVVIACAVTVGPARTWARVRAEPRRLAAGAGLVVVAGLLSVAWVLATGQVGGRQPTVADPSSTTAASLSVMNGDGSWGPVDVLAWLLQAVAAFPYRNQLASPVVYALLGTLAVALLVGGLLEGRGRIRPVLVVTVVATLVIPVVLTALTFDSQGNVWQGRYVLPLGVGIVLLAGRAIDGSGARGVPSWVLGLVAVVLATSFTLGLLMVRDDQLGRAASADDPSWWVPPVAVVVAVVVLAALALALSARRGAVPADARRDPVGVP